MSTYKLALQASKNGVETVSRFLFWLLPWSNSSLKMQNVHVARPLSLSLSLSLSLCVFLSLRVNDIFSILTKIQGKKKKTFITLAYHPPEFGRTLSCLSERSTPQSIFTFPATSMDLLNPLSRPANTTAAPIK
jgi:hypothetical protein